MRRLLTGYAVNFNHRHHRSGHLFQNRYKSIICEEDVYLLELIRYIHLNPLRAKIISDMASLEVYSWCGHSVLLGKRELPGQVVDDVLILFGENLPTARLQYRQFVADGVAQGQKPELIGGGLRRSRKVSGGLENVDHFDDRVLGSGPFVEALQQDANMNAILTQRLSLPEIKIITSQLCEVEPDAILSRARQSTASQARALFCYIAVRLIGRKGTEVANYLSIGDSAVSRLVKRGGQILRDSRALEKKLKIVLNH
jgi:putative transposase